MDTSRFRRYANKRLTSVALSTVTSSKIGCTKRCLETNGCLAVGVTKTDGVMSCYLATDPTDFSDAVDDVASDIFVLGESLKSLKIILLLHDVKQS